MVSKSSGSVNRGVNNLPASSNQMVSNEQSNSEEASQNVEAISEKCLHYKMKIGSGGYGEVFLAKISGSRLTGRFSAVKVMSKLLLNKQAKQMRVKREQKFLRELKHPFIVQMYFSFQTTYLLFMGMEFLQGGDVYEVRERRLDAILPESWAKFYITQIILVLEYLHQQDIVYRDLKPENVMIAADGYIRLIDFGLSLVIKDNDLCKTAAGTNEYMAPEVLNNSGHGKPSDFWSLGVLCYDLLFGDVPFIFDKQQNKMINYKLVFPEGITVSDNAKYFIMSLLIEKPNERLGGKADISDVKNHTFVRHVNWTRLFSKCVKPPFVPELTSAADATYFDPEFTCSPEKEPTIEIQAMRNCLKEEAFSEFHYEIDPSEIFAEDKPWLPSESIDDEVEVLTKRPKFNDVAKSMDSPKLIEVIDIS